jgi:hypothetical protein
MNWYTWLKKSKIHILKTAQTGSPVDLVTEAGWTFVVYNASSKAYKDQIKNAGFKWKSVTFTYKGLPQTGAWGADRKSVV